MNFVVFMDNFVLDFTDSCLDYSVCFFDLEVCDLADHWLNLVLDLFNQLSSLSGVKFCRTLGNHYWIEHHLAGMHHLTVRHHYRLHGWNSCHLLDRS